MIKNKYIISIGLGLLSLTFLIGCGGSGSSSSNSNTTATISTKNQEVKIDKIASADNFKKVLNDYYSRHCIGIDLDVKLPGYKMTTPTLKIDQKYLNLEQLGLVKLSDAKFDRNEGKVGKTNMFGDVIKVEMVNGKKIELTEKGKKYYRLKDKSYAKAEFCLANYEIVAITNYTKPKDFMGMTLSRVNYTAKASNVVPFIDDVSKLKYFDSFKDRTTKEIDKRADLVLTEMKGWMHNKEFKR